MSTQKWDGTRPRDCPNTYCAASDYYWDDVRKETGPKFYMGEDEEDGDAREEGVPYAWSSIPSDDRVLHWWWYCEPCHHVMFPEMRFLKLLRENRIIDASSSVSEG